MPYPNGLQVHTLWDEIASHIDSTNDLLSLALTCYIFKELIIPDHLEFRHIRCDFRRKDVWESLSSRPRPTRGIRILDLIYEPEESVRLPRSLGRDKPDRALHINVSVTGENIKLFKDALSCMTYLTVFSWRQYKASFPEIIDISRVLTNTTHCLEALCIDFYWMSALDADRTQFENLSVWYLYGLKKVIIRHPGLAAVRMIVHLCPDIEDLYLMYLSTTSLLYVMQYGNWKKLRRLNLSLNFTPASTFVPEEPDITMIIGFFSRHDNIESLNLDLINIPMLNSLPKLRSIGSEDLVLTSCLSSDTISGLVHWQAPIDDINFETLPMMDRLETFSLSTYEPCESFFVSFIEKAPNLKKMYLEIGRDWGTDVAEILVNSGQCSKLTHLICENSFSFGDLPAVDESPVDDSDESLLMKRLEICKELSVLPALTYIAQHDAELYVKLKRDQDGKYSGYDFVTFQEINECPDYWGDFFFDLLNSE
ncbi:hypothetical protein Clacol_007039 [Clathrus columnatus]|uniref:F-box domain-containing protein n=1 Tax=Clathrus columnatus TaxID=1419009 RepID=A0AAV5ADU3_9AGAM|nr:hypothetical protein Clacol_007039 [Clathrus columnatus]